MYTVISDYGATGEGRTVMVLYTKGYPVGLDYDDPTKDGKYWALESFKNQFGDWYAAGAEVHQDMVFDFPGSELLLSDKLKESLTNWEKNAGNLEYYASIHVNFS
jgi:hypothetical protein